MTAIPPPAAIDDLERSECYQLLAQAVIGRLAVSQGVGSPVVVPVNFALDGESVIIRLDDGDTLNGVRREHVSFEADVIDAVHHTGWSVLIQGVAFETSPAEVEHLGVEPWAPGPKDHWVRIIPGSVTGRRLRR